MKPPCDSKEPERFDCCGILPAFPQDALNFNELKTGMPFFHWIPPPIEGKRPHLLFVPNRVEPLELFVTFRKYLSLSVIEAVFNQEMTL